MKPGARVLINVADAWDIKHGLWLDGVVVSVEETYFIARPDNGTKRKRFFFAHKGETWLPGITEEDYA